MATGLDPQQRHRVALKLVKKPDTEHTSNNDVFSVKVNNSKWVENTTFEAYYDAVGQAESATDTLLLRISGAPADVQGAGFLIGQVQLSVS